MKKIFKLFPVALAVVALASCSNENDYFAEDGTINAPEGSIIASVEDPHFESGDITRAALADFSDGKYERVVWTEGDAFKLYARCNWRTDKFELASAGYNNTVGVFQCANEDGESHILANDSAYAVFPYSVTVDADGVIDLLAGDEKVAKMQDEERTKLDLFLPTAWPAVKVTGQKAATSSKADAYWLSLPLWGFAWQNSNGTKDIKFKYLTAVLCVNVGSSMPNTAKTIVVEASEDVIAGAFEADVKDLMLDVWNKDVETEAEVNTKTVPTLTPAAGNTTALKPVNKKIIVTLPPTVPAKSKFYIPVPAGKYHNLNVYFGDNTGTILVADTYLRRFGYFAKDAEGKYTATPAVDGTVNGYYEELKASWYYDVNASSAISANIPAGTFVGDNATIAKLNEYLEDLDYSGDIEITVNDALTSRVKVVNKEVVSDTLLVIPASSHNVKITFAEGLTTDDNRSGETTRPLAIKNQGSTLTIAGVDTKVVQYVDIVGESTGTVVIGDYIAPAGYVKTWSPAAVVVNTDQGTKTVKELDVFNASAAVTLTKGTVPALNVNSGTATIGTATNYNENAKATNVVLNTGTLNANLKTGTNDIESVTFKGAGTLNLWDGTVGTIYAATSLNPATKATVNTFNNAIISDALVPGVATSTAHAVAKINFNAKLAKVDGADGTTIKKTAAVAADKIFTAAQFLGVADKITASNLYTNINLDGVKFDFSTATRTPLTLKASLIGDTVTVSNFTLETAAANDYLGLFNVEASADLTISNLTVSGVTAEAKAADKLPGAIGGVIGRVNNTGATTLVNVHLTGENTLGTNAAKDKQVSNIGGLIGLANTEVILGTATDGVTANATIYGYYGLGGLIGTASANVTIGGKKTAKTTATGAIHVQYNNGLEIDRNMGKAAGFIGTVTAGNIVLGDISSANKVITEPTVTVSGADLTKNWFYVSTGASGFTQYYHSNQKYIGYSGYKTDIVFGDYVSGVSSENTSVNVKFNTDQQQKVFYFDGTNAKVTPVADDKALYYFNKTAQ